MPSNDNFITVPNIGLLLSKVPSSLINEIKQEVYSIRDDFSKHVPVKGMLAGNIEKEFALIKCKSNVEKYIIQQTTSYATKYNYKSDEAMKQLPYVLDGLWVNFQKKGEFNPNHTHSGVMSFVIWLDIPFFIADEKNGAGKGSKKNVAGCFEVMYTNVLGAICSYVFPADKTLEGNLLMFPSKMNHCVYPFYTSDDYRISVSGNIRLG